MGFVFILITSCLLVILFVSIGYQAMDHNGVSWRRVCSRFGRRIDNTDCVDYDSSYISE